MERSEKGVDLVGGVSTQFKMGKLLENECMEEGEQEWKCCPENTVEAEVKKESGRGSWECQHNSKWETFWRISGRWSENKSGNVGSANIMLSTGKNLFSIA